jgi:putative hemolysin
MAICPKHSSRGTAPAWHQALAGVLATDLKRLIAGIVSRPYRARPASTNSRAAVSDEVPPAALKAEIDALPRDQRLIDRGGFHVYCSHSRQTPRVLQEIGRLRELTFRAVGEGSGRGADIDAFDAYYLHIFVWHDHARTIVGAYRLGLVDEILATYGKRGLYTHSLFKYGTRMLATLTPAIELGRSFVRVEYQRSFAPMMLLWCGIGRFIERAPQYAVLFGPVSISNRYSSVSRQLIVEYLSTHAADTHLNVKPRRPFRDYRKRFPSNEEASCPGSIDELSRVIAQIEPDHKGVPVLLRHYLRLGGRLLAFNVDREFGNVLDGLIMVDLRQIEPTLLARYMGKSGTLAFRAYHGLDSERAGRIFTSRIARSI